MSYRESIRRYVSQAVQAATELADQVQLEAIEDAARNVLTTVTVLQGVSESTPLDCLDLYRDIPDWEPARVTVFARELGAFACAVPLQRLRDQLITLSNELYAVPGLTNWSNVIGDLAGQTDRVAVELDVIREGATQDRQLPWWVWGLVGLFVLDRVSRFAR